jgi:POT family proton-dependent oligopeptide transporter
LTTSSNPYAPGSDLPGALGRGQAVASALGNFFKFWAYASTVFGAIVADQYLGKFKAILAASAVYIIGLVILVATATPSAIQSGAGFGGLVAAMITIGLGTGGYVQNICHHSKLPSLRFRTRAILGLTLKIVDTLLTSSSSKT